MARFSITKTSLILNRDQPRDIKRVFQINDVPVKTLVPHETFRNYA